MYALVLLPFECTSNVRYNNYASDILPLAYRWKVCKRIPVCKVDTSENTYKSSVCMSAISIDTYTFILCGYQLLFNLILMDPSFDTIQGGGVGWGGEWGQGFRSVC